MTSAPELLLHGYKEIGRHLGITPRQVEYLAVNEGLPTFKLGRSVCANSSSLIAWLRSKEKASAS